MNKWYGEVKQYPRYIKWYVLLLFVMQTVTCTMNTLMITATGEYGNPPYRPDNGEDKDDKPDGPGEMECREEQISPGLEELDLSGNTLLNVDRLSNLTSLRKLKAGKAETASLDFLKPLINLTHLDISEIRVMDISALGHLKKLTTLKMRAFPKLDFSILDTLENLSDFSLTGSLAGDTGIFTCHFMKKLKKLSMKDNYLPDTSFFSRYTQLESLDVTNTEIKEVGPLAGLTSLDTIILTHNRIRDIAPLSKLKKLTYINADYNNISDRSVLSGFSEKTKISLYGQKDGDAFILEDGAAVAEWPRCLSAMRAIDVNTDRLPDYFLTVYEKQGITRREDINIPIKNIVPLGHCPVSRFLECPNFPEHHLYRDAKALDSGIGSYYWFDFDLLSADTHLIPLRLVFCYGDGDANDGMWGAFWHRETKHKVADIKSTGDMETTIEVSDKIIKEQYKNHDIRVPVVFNHYKEPRRYRNKPDFIYAHETELEKMLGVAIRLCESFRSKNIIKIEQIRQKPVDLAPGVVFFEDTQLEKYVKKLLHKTGPVLVSDVEAIKDVAADNRLVIKLTGLEYFTSLVSLDVSGNKIRDISPLAGLKKLKKLNLSDNDIADIAPLL